MDLPGDDMDLPGDDMDFGKWVTTLKKRILHWYWRRFKPTEKYVCECDENILKTSIF